jgi:uncharacterized protein
MTSNSKRPFIKRFKTQRACYVYDVNTSRILAVDGVVYEILGDYGHLSVAEIRQKYTPKYGRSCVEQALDEIEDTYNNENLFLPDRPHALSFGLTREDLEHSYTTQLGSMTLELTEHCNLRCHYCTVEYNRTNEKRMSTKTALAAIDFLCAHSSDVKQRNLGFYGGEPLLEFELITQCVDYARSKFGSDGVRFSLTTNGVLLDENKASYFAENQFNIFVSVDGPQRIHDKHRVDRAGNGSYKRTINGLRFLLSAYGADAHGKVGLIMIVTPPYDLDALMDLWEEEPWLPKNIHPIVNYVDATWTNFLRGYSCNLAQDIHHRSKKNQLLSFKRYLHGEPEHSPISTALFEQGLLKIYKRPFFHAPRKYYPLNGCCIPGVRKLFVTCDGTLQLCERVHDAPALGSIWTGYDPSVMWSIIEDYAKESISDCKRCWAVALCSLCYGQAYFNGRFSIEFKRKFCPSQQNLLEEQLKRYCSILEEYPHALDYMKDMELL